MTRLIKPTIVDGIEFYVSQDGTRAGVSVAGLARLCGVSKGTMSELLAKLGTNTPFGKTGSKTLESAMGEPFDRSVEGERGAKIVTQEAAAAIITYYAYETDEPRVEAKFALRQFTSRGFTNWVKEVTGYAEENNYPMLLATMQDVLTELKEIKVENRQYRSLKETVQNEEISGMAHLMQVYASYPDRLLLPDERRLTCNEWLELSKGITSLDPSRKHKFYNLVAETYRTITKKEPQVIYRPHKMAVYRAIDFPILEIAFNMLMHS